MLKKYVATALAALVLLQAHPPTEAASVRSQVDQLGYRFHDMTSPMQAFRLVAAERGWTQAEITSWEAAVSNIIFLESGGCWNLRRGASLPNAGASCTTVSGVSRNSDSGFGQVTRIWWKQGAPVCKHSGICSAESVVASPYNSMTALLVVLESDPRLRWSYCYNRRARSYHRGACTQKGLPSIG